MEYCLPLSSKHKSHANCIHVLAMQNEGIILTSHDTHTHTHLRSLSHSRTKKTCLALQTSTYQSHPLSSSMGGADKGGAVVDEAVLLTTVPRPSVAAALPTYPVTLYLF